MIKTIDHFFPNLFTLLSEVEECRKRPKYEIAEILFSVLILFLFKKSSRNAMNMERREEKFLENYEKIFHFKLPHMDTVDRVMMELSEELLEEVKKRLVHDLLKKKIFNNSRLYKYHRIAIDATRVMNVEEGHCDCCLYTKHGKKGKITWFHNVLEAKLITPWGICISLGTEWIENSGSAYTKQDCELKAFRRLAVKIRKSYPRLKICVIADGLYPNETFFRICESMGWKWLLTFQD